MCINRVKMTMKSIDLPCTTSLVELELEIHLLPIQDCTLLQVRRGLQYSAYYNFCVHILFTYGTPFRVQIIQN
jgi:hypothetical protein